MQSVVALHVLLVCGLVELQHVLHVSGRAQCCEHFNRVSGFQVAFFPCQVEDQIVREGTCSYSLLDYAARCASISGTGTVVGL